MALDFVFLISYRIHHTEVIVVIDPYQGGVWM